MSRDKRRICTLFCGSLFDEYGSLFDEYGSLFDEYGSLCKGSWHVYHIHSMIYVKGQDVMYVQRHVIYVKRQETGVGICM